MASPFPFQKHLRPGQKVLLSLSAADHVGSNQAGPLIDTRVLATIHSTEGRGGVTAIRLTLDEHGKRGGHVSAGAHTAMESGRRRKHAMITKAIGELCRP